MTTITPIGRNIALVCAAGASAIALAATAQAQDAVDLAGKTVKFVIPFSESPGLRPLGEFLCAAP